jgi:hypothetical protein
MPWSVKKPTAAEIAPNWLQPYCKQFMQEQSYALILPNWRGGAEGIAYGC